MTANKESKNNKLGNRSIDFSPIEYDVEGVVAIVMSIRSSISRTH